MTSRISASQHSSSLIDHVFAKLKDISVESFGVEASCGVSDHQLISFPLASYPAVSPFSRTCKIDYDAVERAMQRLDWAPLFLAPDPDSKANILHGCCSRLLDQNSTTRIIKPRFRPLEEWMTPGLVRSVRKRAKLYKRLKSQRTFEAKILYDSYNQRLKRVTADDKPTVKREEEILDH